MLEKQITLAELKTRLPANFKSIATEDTVELINNIEGSPEFKEVFVDNFLSYSSVFVDGNYKMENYLNALKYVSLKISGNMSNRDAYYKTFPERVKEWEINGKSPKDQASLISAYDRTKLVTELSRKVIVPTWLLNQDVVQRAVNTLDSIMQDETASNKARVDAANALLNHLKAPEEVQQAQINIGIQVNNPITDMQAEMANLIKTQRSAINEVEGITVNDVVNLRLEQKDA